MSNLSIPLQITDKGFLREESMDRSIQESILMLLQTPYFGCAADPEYGFIFKNLRFEIFNENDGTVDNSQMGLSPREQKLYDALYEALYNALFVPTVKEEDTFMPLI